MKKVFLKKFAKFTGKHLRESLFLSCNFIKKETLVQGFSCEFCKIEHVFYTSPLDAASILQQLLALYSAITFSWQLSSSEKSLVRKNTHPYISRILQIQISFFHFFHFFLIFFDKCLFTLSFTRSVFCTLSNQTFCWLGGT